MDIFRKLLTLAVSCLASCLVCTATQAQTPPLKKVKVTIPVPGLSLHSARSWRSNTWPWWARDVVVFLK